MENRRRRLGGDGVEGLREDGEKEGERRRHAQLSRGLDYD